MNIFFNFVENNIFLMPTFPAATLSFQIAQPPKYVGHGGAQQDKFVFLKCKFEMSE
jgi:hypothetical protein